MYCGNPEDDLNEADLARGHSYDILNLGSENENLGDYAADTRMSRPPLRSRPAMDFYASERRYPSSHTSGSTLHSNPGSNPNFSMLPHKAAYSSSSLGSPRPSV